MHGPVIFSGKRGEKQTNASHYCSARLCSALGNPSQSTQIQLLLLNQFEAAATSHLSQYQTRASGRLCTQQQLLLVGKGLVVTCQKRWRGAECLAGSVACGPAVSAPLISSGFTSDIQQQLSPCPCSALQP